MKEMPELSKREKWAKEFKSISLIIIAVLAFRSTLFEPFKIPTGSMIPTLLIGDFILVNKFSYGFKVPFSDWFGDPIYMTEAKAPKRGDIIVFKYPRNTDLNYIKRVIGLPGDTIEVVDKVVYVNNKPINMVPHDGQKIMEDMDDKYKRYNLKFFKVKTGEHEHVVQLDEDTVHSANFYKVTVPENNFFVMGDNRDFSADSRIWGTVPFGHIKGKAILVWFNLTIPFPETYDGETFKFRPWRIGTIVD